MTIADITLAIFTLCNSLRVVAYIPQISKAARDRGGAEAISFGTWSLFLVSHMSAVAYALVNKNDWTMASMFLCNAIGCCVIIAIAAWKRSRYRSRHREGSIKAWLGPARANVSHLHEISSANWGAARIIETPVGVN